MATPRKRLVDPVTPLFYHLASRCVRRSWLCGKDPISRKDFSHRKQWLIDRMRFLAQFFAIELHAYTIMSNHFHLVVFLDPKASLRWSDQQVVDRWLAVCPPRTWTGDIDLDAIPDLTARLLDDPERLLYLRSQLGSLSTFMKHLKQPIARRANQEDGCKGHFFEQRFYSGALLSERAIVAAMAYVDINPIRAAIEKTIEDCANSSIALRLADLDRPVPHDRPVAAARETGCRPAGHGAPCRYRGRAAGRDRIRAQGARLYRRRPSRPRRTPQRSARRSAWP